VLLDVRPDAFGHLRARHALGAQKLGQIGAELHLSGETACVG
jgi:hypothetical protein